MCVPKLELGNEKNRAIFAWFIPAGAGNYIFYNILLGSSPLLRGTCLQFI